MLLAVLCVSLLGALLFALGLLISMLRTESQAFFYGLPPDPRSFLTKAVRAHANTAEFAPMLSILIIYLGAHTGPSWVTWAMLAATASRVLMVIGFLTCHTLEKIHPLKAIGAMGTYFSGLALCVAAAQTVL